MHWQTILRKNFTRAAALTTFLELSQKHVEELDITPTFPMSVPVRLAQKMEKRTTNDPIFKQFVPSKKELLNTPHFSQDPIEEMLFLQSEKLLHKYPKRMLLVTTSSCAMHCRFCFRRNFPYETTHPHFDKELALIQKDHSIEEIILSGGDPLSLSDRALSELFTELNTIEHLQRIRFHTRFPIGIPERINEPFLELLQSTTKQIVFVIHSNHPKEFDEEVWESLHKIQKLGIPILNQSVLLKGVNDDVQTQKELLQALVNHGVIPYYLHALDKVAGAAHFDVPQATGKRLINELAKTLSGYAVPKFVREIPGKPSKTILVKLNFMLTKYQQT